MTLKLRRLSGDFSIAQVDHLDRSLIDQMSSQSPHFWTVAQTSEEISVVSNIAQHSSFSKVEGPWTAFRVVGQLDFSLTGILSRCSTLLADAKISVFAVSTFDTDYFLVRKESEVAAISAWRLGGIIIDEI